MRVCSVDGCGGAHWAKGMCNTHYVAEYRKANPGKATMAAKLYAKRHAEKVRTYQAAYRAAHAEKHNAYNAEYRSRPENKQIASVRTKQWYQDNIERARKEGSQRSLAWARAHPQEAKVRARAWDFAHPEERKARQALRRARKRGAEGRHAATEVKALFIEQRGECVVCHTDLSDGFHKDHIQALSRGGSNWIENIQLLCPSCNHRKGVKNHDAFLNEHRVRQ